MRKMRQILSRKYEMLSKIISTFIRKTLNRSDYKRWGSLNELSETWDNRTIEMAKYILPNSKVIEFGAGRIVLKDFLPKNCTYTPSDIVDRGKGTIICDLNKTPLPEFEHYDYSVFSGVLEYVNNVPKLIEHLSMYMDSFIISYATISEDSKNIKRGMHGWVNNYTEKNIIEIFQKNGFSNTNRSTWRNQVIFVFSKNDKNT